MWRDTRWMDPAYLGGSDDGRRHDVTAAVLIAVGVVVIALAVVGALVIIAATGGVTC